MLLIVYLPSYSSTLLLYQYHYWMGGVGKGKREGGAGQTFIYIRESSPKQNKKAFMFTWLNWFMVTNCLLRLQHVPNSGDGFLAIPSEPPTGGWTD